MMAQYLLALLGAQQPGGMRGPGGDPIAELLFGGLSAQEGGGRPGRMGDYIFNQEGKKIFHYLAMYLSSNLLVSFGPDHHTVDGEL